jgi:cytochrome c biogenesis protein CcmG, thiol:disulfide interchange protein DsbE
MSQFPEHGTHEDASANRQIGSMRRIRTLRVVAAVLIVAAVVLLLRGLLTPAQPTGATSGHSSSGVSPTATVGPADPLVGHYSPDVTVHDMRDHLTPLSSLRGSVVLLNFWYVACLPCQIEMPALERAYLAHKAQGFTVIGLDVVDDTQTISEFTSRLGITYPILRDIGQRAVLAYQLRATPSSFLIDRDDVIRAVYTGPLTVSTLNQQLSPLLSHP